MHSSSSKLSLKRSAFVALSAAILLGSLVPTIAKTTKAQEQRAPRFARAAEAQMIDSKNYVPNQLVIMPHKGADPDDQREALENVHGHVIKSTTNGELTCQLVEIEPGMLPEAYRKLSKDRKDFDSVQLNFYAFPEAFPATAPNDPIYPQSYWLSTLNVPKAWALPGTPSGLNVVIGLMDSGCDANQADLQGKILTGYNAYTSNGPGNYDSDVSSASVGHGSACASLMVGRANNGKLGSGIAYNALVNPVICSGGTGAYGNIYTLINGLFWLEKQKVRIINCSFAVQPPYGLTNLAAQPAWAQAVKEYYEKYNGLLFVPAGNFGKPCTNCSPTNNPSGYDTNPRSVYVIPSSGFDGAFRFATFSVMGKSLWFGGPAVNIVVTGNAGKIMTISGTSAASPMNAAVAALCLGMKPTLNNADILIAMANNTRKVGDQPAGTASILSGLGIPDAEKTLKSVLGLR